MFHSALSFSLSAALLTLVGSPIQYAFIAAILTIIIDLDRTISPDQRHERCMHSLTALALTALLPFIALMIAFPLHMSMLPFIAWSSHMMLDVMHGETIVTRPFASVIDPMRWYRPRIASVLDISGLAAGGLFLLF